MSAFEHYQAVVQHHKTLGQILQRLPSNADCASDLAALVTAAKRELDHAAASMPALLQQITVEERTSPATALVAEKVFEIPELFERILCNLDITDLLKAQQVNHRFFETIQSSPMLQWHMGLAPDAKHDFRLTLENRIRGFMFSTDASMYARQIDGDNVAVRLQLFGRVAMPKLGERARSILICQPPLKSIALFVDCCSGMYSTFQQQQLATPISTITSDTGITLGDIIDAAKAVKDQHRTCPRAREHEHDAQGNVDVNINFEGVLPVAATDKALLEKRNVQQAVEEEKKMVEAKRARLGPYLAAKSAAVANGTRILTLEEFEAAQGSQ
ncbi:hypothetical protein LTR85_008411 [Meristemomyces frigidus]|nr:hypothetical protein LTR85_008411 [Meristemomyces frigidus]